MVTRTWMKLAVVSMLAFASFFVLSCGDDDEENGGAAATQPAGGASGIAGESVDVLGIWGADELPKFEEMVKPWEDSEDASMDFTGTRGLAAILTSRVEGGNPPDVAIPAEVGLFQQFAEEGLLTPLADCGLEEEIKQNYPASFVDLATVDGQLYGFFMKADSKGSIWYSPPTFEENGYEVLTEDSTWDDLLALADEMKADGLTPWSIGLASEADSGWPGSDWLQQIILNMDGGEDLYDGLVEGSIPYTDPRVKQAWERFGQIALTEGNVSQGSPAGINATNFQDSTYAPFQEPPEAGMVYLGAFASSFISKQFPNLTAGEDFDFFPFPGGKVTGAANIVYAFNSDPATCSLLRHLASGEAQRIWVESGGFTSLNEDVALDAYPNASARAAAEQLLDADVFRFDLDDAIGGATQQAIFAGVSQYIANRDQLDTILAGVEATR
ncbi:MAG: extracellular solute-binding protein [Dehalococcoidia bacterium]|nr:extracellular solute-binding protein [Dehalococcoidia bacterium]